MIYDEMKEMLLKGSRGKRVSWPEAQYVTSIYKQGAEGNRQLRVSDDGVDWEDYTPSTEDAQADDWSLLPPL